jgi:hypothetical protein
MQGTYESGAVRNTSQTRLIMAAGQKRFVGKILTFEEMALKPFARQFYGLVQQYVKKPVVVNMLGQDGMKYVTLKPSDIKRDLDFIPMGSRQLVELEQVVHQMNNFMSVANGIPYSPALVNYRYLLQKVWDAISPDHDGTDVVLSDEDAKRSFEEMKQLMQMGGATSIMDGGAQPAQAITGAPSINSINPSQPNMAGGVQ